MSSDVRRHLQCNAVAYVALFVALSGTAYAVDGPLAGQNTVGSQDIINGEVAREDLGANSVGTDKIVDGRVKNDDLGPGAADSHTTRDDGLRSIDIRDDTLPGGGLTGDDIDEAALDGVPFSTATAQSANDSSPFRVTTASCPTGMKAVAGGVNVGGDDLAIAITDSTPSGETGSNWTVTAHEHTAIDSDWQLSVTALCLAPAR